MNGVKNLLEIRIYGVLAIVVGMAEVFDVFGKIAKKENVRVVDFTGDLNLAMLSQEGATK